MKDEWFALDEFNQVRGPYTRAEILALVGVKDCLICREGMTTWASPDLLPELRLPPPTGRTYILDAPVTSDARLRPRSGRDAARVLGKSMDEFLGIIKGIVADRHLNDQEITFLKGWLDGNGDVSGAWPADQIARRIREVLRDGVVTSDERTSLMELMESAVGGPPPAMDAPALATRLPFDKPPPPVEFHARLFCFTGTFAYGARSKCEEAVVLRGGRCTDRLTAEVEYLVIGVNATRSWAHVSFGRKVEAAVALKRAGHPVKIVGEEHWISAMQSSAATRLSP